MNTINSEQRHVLEVILHANESKSSQIFFIDGRDRQSISAKTKAVFGEGFEVTPKYFPEHRSRRKMVTETRASWNDEADAQLADLVQEQVLKGTEARAALNLRQGRRSTRSSMPAGLLLCPPTEDSRPALQEAAQFFPEVEGYLWLWLGRRTFGSDSRGRRLGCFRTEISLAKAISGAGLAPLQYTPRGVHKQYTDWQSQSLRSAGRERF